MNRRETILAMLAFGAGMPLMVRAQPDLKRPTLGILSSFPPPTPDELARSPFMRRLRELGWIEGQTIHVERAYSNWQRERLDDLMAGLLSKRVDVIWAITAPDAVAAARATKTIPIVFGSVDFPVERGLVDSLARPGRNVTGMALIDASELLGKQLSLLREVAPSVKRVAWIGDKRPTGPVAGGRYDVPHVALEAAARQLGFELNSYVLEGKEDLDVVFAAIVKSRANAITVPGTISNFPLRHLIAELAQRYRILSCFNQREFVEAGGLISYGPDVTTNVLRSLDYVDRVLRGSKPADLPVQLPSHFDLAINLRTANALGLKIPQTVLARADRVIE